MNNKKNIYYLCLIIILVILFRKPFNVKYIDNTAHYKLSGKVIKMKSLHVYYATGFYIKLTNDTLNYFLLNENGKKKDKNGKWISFIDSLKINDSIYKRKDNKKIFVYRKNKLIFDFSID